MDKSIKSDGVFSFEITESNNQKIHALILYAQMLDLVVTGDPGNDMEHINADGVINELVNDITDRRIKELCKRHGFTGIEEFVDAIGSCEKASDVLAVIQNAEKFYYKRAHEQVLSQIPVEDKQARLPL